MSDINIKTYEVEEPIVKDLKEPITAMDVDGVTLFTLNKESDYYIDRVFADAFSNPREYFVVVFKRKDL